MYARHPVVFAGDDALVVGRKIWQRLYFFVGPDHYEGWLMALEVHAFECLVFVADEIEDHEFEVFSKICTVEYSRKAVGGNVVDVFWLLLSWDGRFDWAPLCSFMFFLGEFPSDGGVGGEAGDFDV